MPSRPRVLLAEDHALVAQGLRALLDEAYEVVDVIAHGGKVVAAVGRHRPEVLLLDISMPGRTGLDLIPDVRRKSPATRILVLTMHSDYLLAQSALHLGATGFIPKNCEAEELHGAITEVLQGRRYLSPRVAKHPIAPVPDVGRKAYDKLSPRQKEVVRGLRQGLSTEELAEEMGVTTYTVHFHRRRIRQLLGIESEDGLLRFVMTVPPDAL